MLPKLLVLLAALVPAGAAQAAFHLMEIEQVIGGVGGDTQAQAVQLAMRNVGQNILLGTAQLVARDAAGANPVVLTTFGSNVTSGSCRQILVATDAFAAKTTPAAVRNFAMIPIPAGYLPAGSLTFETLGGATIYWRVSWGGAAYTGSGSVLAGAEGIANDDNNNTLPAVAGPLPSNSAQALRFTPACPTRSTDSAAQYGVTAGPAVFTNNALANFTVNAVVAAPIPTLPSWGWLALASALGLVGIALVRRRSA